ncbi:conjugal transfer protein [Salmonella enterica subsp. enterica serovar Enteritidis]|uniref:type 4 pilus major pilin n=1 Tax=Salmonella enterica TaxID=28901 RepID=UPI001308FAB1|nr:conjugal transfer protein [Salmonella enterica subsp. enterica serovar Enteritidis]ELC6755275.1 conjugal transfer protein [Salmonella enterica]ELC6804949.1 conjugal transfer protein [Salmonella enterica]ELW7881236.1 conjugal transfer protein [Salmonella enterica]
MKIVNMKRGIANITDSVVSLGIMLVVIAVVMGLSWVGYSKFYSANEVTVISNIINETKNMRASSGYGTSDYNQALINGGALPSSVSYSGSTINNRTGGTITVKGAGVGFTVTDTMLSNKDCINLAQKLGTSEMASTKINSQSFTGEVTAVMATSACTTDSNTVVFTTKS